MRYTPNFESGVYSGEVEQITQCGCPFCNLSMGYYDRKDLNDWLSLPLKPSNYRPAGLQ